MVIHSYKPTASQRLIWFDQAISPNSARYNIGGYAYLQGELRYNRFNEAIRQLINAQEVYRTRFEEVDFEVSCLVDAPLLHYTMEVVDLSGNEDAEMLAVKRMEEDFALAFDVHNSHLFRFILLKVSNEKHLWYAKIHHLISDGMSFRLLLNQASEAYSALSGSDQVSLPTFLYSDYSIDDDEYYQSSFVLDDRAFWINEFTVLPGELLSKKHHQAITAGKGASDTLRLSPQTKSSLESIAKASNVSVFNIIIGLLLLYFSRTRRQNDIVLGIPVLNRTKKKYRSTAGVFMNLLAIKFSVDQQGPFNELVKMVKEKMSKCLRHQRYQYGNLVKELKTAGDKPLYDIRVSYEDFEFTSQFDNLKTGAVALSNHTEIDKLAIYLRDYHDQGFDVRFVYDPAYCSPEEISSIKDSLDKMITDLPFWQLPVAKLDLLPEKDQLLASQLAAGPIGSRREHSFIDLWLNASNLFANNTCVSTATGKYSYNTIHNLALALAGALNNKVMPGGRVALLLPRSEKMIIGLLGSMMAGLTYIPLDVDYPPERIRQLLQDAGCHYLLSSRDLLAVDSLENTKVLFIEEGVMGPVLTEAVINNIESEHPCYILYTSGSTGLPKGVVISHDSMVDYVCTFRDYFNIACHDVVIQQSSIGFDTSVEEIFPVLSVGGRLHIVEDRKDVFNLATVLSSEEVTLLSTSPLVIKALNDIPLPATLHTIISGGDVFKTSYATNITARNIKVYNTYGPTESTVCATYYRVHGEEDQVPIGKPITNREIFILDDQQQLQPPGIEGEICIGGKGLAMGYLDNSELTRQQFIPHILNKEKKLYRTGDVGVMMPDGNIMFKGRKDEQLSFRGYRIEAGEIENIIIQKCGVAHCVVTISDYDGIPRLVAYLQTANGEEEYLKWVKTTVAAWLPLFMVPEVIIIVPEFHLLSSGKVDKRKLPAIEQHHWAGSNRRKELPANEMEKELFTVWCEILRSDAFGVLESFFDIGGNSLHAVQLLNYLFKNFGVKLSIRELFEGPSIREQARLITSKTPGQFHAIGKVQEAPDYVASSGQQRLWLLDQSTKGSRAYNLAGEVFLEGDCNISCFERALQTLLERNEILRTKFKLNDQGQLRQVINPAGSYPFQLTYLDGSAWSGEQVKDYIATAADTAFDLATGPLFRAGIVRINAGEHIFHYSMHHIISDGWSMEILKAGLLSYYEQYVRGELVTAPLPRIQYKDYASWQLEQLKTGKSATAKQYWLEQFSGELPVLDMPLDLPRATHKPFDGGMISTRIGARKIKALSTLCQQEGCTLYMGLLSLVNALLFKYSGQEDIIIGSPVAGRDHVELEDQIGFFINTIALRTAFNEMEGFTVLLKKVQHTTLAAYDHQQYPFDELVGALSLPWDKARNPLFDVMVVLQRSIPGAGPLQESSLGLKATKYTRKENTDSKVDLVFDFTEAGEEGVEMRIEYNNQLFRVNTIERMARHIGQLLSAIVEQPQVALGELDLLNMEEKEQLSGFNNRSLEYPKDKTVIDLFEEQVERTPGNTALVGQQQQLTYRELNEKANRLADHLKVQHLVKPEALVGIQLDRGPWMVVCILAVLKLGAAYIPVDPEYPEERSRYMVTDSQCILLIDGPFIAAYAKEEQKYNAGNPAAPTNPGHLAYVIYTSGSTGLPKGVMVEHAALMNLCYWHITTFAITAADRATLYAGVAFDASVWELFPYLLKGAALYVVPGAMRLDVEELAAYYEANAITISFLPTQIAEQFMAVNNRSLRYLLTGGDKLNYFIDKPYRVINNYGPTEATVVATSGSIIEQSFNIPIGSPVANTSIFILNKQNRLQPPGVVGEIYIGGAGLARGYLHQPLLTAEKFIDNPYRPGKKMYKTGDLGRWLPDGQIEFAGRIDEQVKIRGYRIETGEIEAMLKTHPAIEAAAVMVITNSNKEKELVAYMVAHAALRMAAVREFLAEKIPVYMIPARFAIVNELPLTPNGKLDKKQLLSSRAERLETGIEYIGPRNETEAKLVSIWESVLNREQVGVRDNFFELGGNSLIAARIITRIKQVFLIHLNIQALFEEPTIESVAEQIIFIISQEDRKKDKERMIQLEL